MRVSSGIRAMNGYYSLRIIRGCNLHDICAHDVKAIETSQDGAEFARRPAPCLRRACCRSERRIYGIDLKNMLDTRREKEDERIAFTSMER
jgi:hypothetical protein